MAQQANLTLELDKVKDLLLCQGDTGVAQLLNAVLDQILKAEATEQIGAESYKRSDNRTTQRNGYRTREFTTRLGVLELHIPKLRDGTFSTELFKRYDRSEQAFQLAVMEMVVNGVSTRKVSAIVEQLCGRQVSKSTVSELCKGLSEDVNQFKNTPLGEYCYVITDAIYIKVREDHKVVSKCLMIALGITPEGYREVIGFEANNGENKETWKSFFEGLKDRGLSGVKYVVSDDHGGLKKAVKEAFAGAMWQRCQAHFERNILSSVSDKHRIHLRQQLKDMFNAPSEEEAIRRKDLIIENHSGKTFEKAMKCLENGFDEVCVVYGLPEHHRIKMRTSNIIERLNEEIRRRERVIRIFPNEESLERLIGALLKEINDDWISRKYINMDL